MGGLGEDSWGVEQCSELVSKLSPSIFWVKNWPRGNVVGFLSEGKQRKYPHSFCALRQSKRFTSEIVPHKRGAGIYRG